MSQYATSGTNSLTPNPVPPAMLLPGDSVYVFGLSYVGGTPTPGQILTPNDSNVQFEAVTLGERSIAVALAPRPGGGAPPGLMVQVNCSINPSSTMEVDIQDSSIDADGAYITNTSSAIYKMTAWTLNGGIYTTWAELQPEGGVFVSLKIVALTANMKLTAKITYV